MKRTASESNAVLQPHLQLTDTFEYIIITYAFGTALGQHAVCLGLDP